MLLPSQISIRKKNQFSGHNAGIFILSAGTTAQNILSGAGDGVVAEWDLDASQTAKGLIKIQGSIFSLLYFAPSQLLFAGSLDGTLFITDLIQKKEIFQFSPGASTIYDLKLFGNTKIIIACGNGCIYIWEVDKQQLINTLKIAEKSIRNIVISPDQKEIVFACSDHQLYVYSTDDFSLKYILKGHTNSVFCAAFTLNGKYLISGSRDAQLIVWDVENSYHQKHILPAHMFTINDIKMSPDALFFATAGRDKHIKIWDAENFNLLKVIDREKFEGHTNSVNKLFWSNWNNYLISCGDDRKVMVWQVEAEVNSPEPKQKIG